MTETISDLDLIYSNKMDLSINIYNGNSYLLRTCDYGLFLSLNGKDVIKINRKPKTLQYLKQKLKKEVSRIENKEAFEIFFTYHVK